jgi:1-deoxy-D-xylulose-5-phosphate synthase
LGVILEKIHEPADLKKLSLKELEQLAGEIREFMTEVISKRGGHLASSLGVVELTIALHFVFNAPHDKILWDVGHQCYTHKILTGRQEQFSRIRCYNGISGFPKRRESLYDVFGVGHSSTSLSAALGIAQARDLLGNNNFVINIIGDGALTGGMALEALNFAGEKKTDLLVILNDNEMSIDQNIGGLPSYLAKLRTDPKYFRLKEDLEHVLERIPAIGRTVLRSAERLKDSLKYLLVPVCFLKSLALSIWGSKTVVGNVVGLSSLCILPPDFPHFFSITFNIQQIINNLEAPAQQAGISGQTGQLGGCSPTQQSAGTHRGCEQLPCFMGINVLQGFQVNGFTFGVKINCLTPNHTLHPG